jgi:hypothetical protein
MTTCLELKFPRASGPSSMNSRTESVLKWIWLKAYNNNLWDWPSLLDWGKGQAKILTAKWSWVPGSAAWKSQLIWTMKKCKTIEFLPETVNKSTIKGPALPVSTSKSIKKATSSSMCECSKSTKTPSCERKRWNKQSWTQSRSKASNSTSTWAPCPYNKARTHVNSSTTWLKSSPTFTTTRQSSPAPDCDW